MTTYRIGRGEENDIVIDDRSVSRDHAELREEADGRYLLHDLGSTNGTFVRDAGEWMRIEQAYVSADERILIGDTATSVTVLLGGTQAKQAAAAAPTAESDPEAPATPATGDVDPAPKEAADAATAARRTRKPILGRWGLTGVLAALLLAIGTVAVLYLNEDLTLPRFGTGKSGASTATGPTKPTTPTTKPTKTVTWQRTFGTKGNDGATALTLTKDGGVVVAGYTSAKGSGALDGWLVRLDADGKKIWARRAGGRRDDRFNDVRLTSDGGLVAVGLTRSKGAGGNDVFVVRFNAKGKILWQKTFGGKKGDYAKALYITAKDELVIAGYTLSKGKGGDAWLIKLDKNGKKIWDRPHGGRGLQSANAIAPAAGGGFVIAGSKDRARSRVANFWALKTNDKGKRTWQTSLGGSRPDVAFGAVETIDGGHILVGQTASHGKGSGDAWVVKLDGKGKKLWSRAYGGRLSDGALAVAQVFDGGFVIAGWTSSKGAGKEDGWLIKIDKLGRKRWERTFGGAQNDRLLAVRAIEGGGFVAAGRTESTGAGKGDLWVLRLDAEGKLVKAEKTAAKGPDKKDKKDKKKPQGGSPN